MRFRRFLPDALLGSVLLSAFVPLAAGAPVKPGSAPGSVHEQAGVSLVEVPVTVVDRDGNPIRGLTASDFDVRDDGKTVVLQAVDESEFPSGTIAPAAPAAAPRAAVSAAARRRFLLLFDFSFSTPSRVTRIREAARKFVTQQIGPDDLVSVATYSLEHGFNLVLTFTSDRSQLSRAVETLGFVNTTEKTADPLQLTSVVPTEWAQGGPPAQGTGRMADIDLENLRDLGRAYKRNDDAYRRGRVTQLLGSFGSLAKALDAVEGRKQIIYFSQGFDIRLLQGNSQDAEKTTEQNENAAHGAIWTIDSEARFGSSGLQAALNNVLDAFKRSDCVVHTVDLSGLTAANEQNDTDPSNGAGQAALFAIADGTGGELFKNANDFGGQLDDLLKRESVVYVLAFSPKLTGHPAAFHNLKVKVKRAGVRVSARAGYFEPKPFSASSMVEKTLTAADAIASEIPVHDLPVSAEARPFAGKGLPMVMVEIRVPGSALIPPAGKTKLPVEIYGYAFDAAGRVADFSTERAMLDMAQVKGKLEKGGLRYFAQLKLPPGSYRVRTLVREGESGAMGLTALDVNVPDFDKRSPYLIQPLVVGAGEGLILRGKSARGGDAEPFPYMAGADPFLPETHPQVSPGSSLKLCVYAYALGDASKVRIGGQLFDAAGKPVGDAKLSLLGHANADDFGRATYLLAWNPEGLSPGSYQLRIIVQDPSSGASRQATTAVAVR